MIATGADRAHALARKHGPGRPGWARRLHQAFGYTSPDAWYEGTVLRIVRQGDAVLDAGGGAAISPHNRAASALIAERCAHLVALDQSDNVLRHALAHERVQATLQAYAPNRTFDVICLRMVAEHVADPPGAVAALARLVRPGGYVIIYTVSRFAVLSMLGAVLPHTVHIVAMRLLFGGAARDTHPAYYRMNTRAKLDRLFTGAGFAAAGFQRLDDCRTTQRWRGPHVAELCVWRVLSWLGVPYPEACLLAVYRREPPANIRGA